MTKTPTIMVIHTSQMDEVVSFLTSMGLKFTKEKHGEGPEHYSFEMNGHLLEIYPPKPSKSAEGMTLDNGERIRFLL